MLKKIFTTLVIALLFLGCANSTQPSKKKFARFQSVEIEKTTMFQSGKDKYSCPQCGMKLPMFYKTNHTATSNKKVKQYCSIHCLAEDRREHKLENIRVVAVDTLKFISVKDATYVVGSDIKGTMSGLSKYAFEGRMSARRFAKKNGGRVMNFEEAYKYALKDFAN
jgi:nitrous oxide reductase accessory protein NosL